jgi:hypothetical protein
MGRTGPPIVREDIMSLDLTALAPTDADMPAVQRAGRTPKDNPFVAWLKESYENKTAKAVTVPAASVREVVYLVRAADRALNIGSRIALADNKGNRCDLVTVGEGDAKRVVPVREDDTEVKGNVKVTFMGKERKQRKAQESTAPVADGTGAVPASS